MKFSEYPQEVKDKVKERVEQQGNTFDESVFDRNITADKRMGGFTWHETPERGDDFWGEVLQRKNFNLFFKKYPERCPSTVTQAAEGPVYSSSNYPTDAEAGSKWIYYCDIGMDGVSSLTPLSRFDRGDVVVLKHNDGSTMPSFHKEGSDRTESIYWSRLKPFDGIVVPKASPYNYHNYPKDAKVGTQYKVVELNTQLLSYNLELGDIVTLYKQDGSSCPGFQAEKFKGDYHYMDWHCFAPVEQQDLVDLVKKADTKEVKPIYNRENYPRTAKVGTKYKVICFNNLNGENYSSEGLRIGDILTLRNQDGSGCPYFTGPDGKEFVVYWSFLAPVEDDSIGITITDFQDGDVVEVINTTNITGEHWEKKISLGERFIIDGSDAIHLNNPKSYSCHPQSNKYAVNFSANMLKVVERNGKIITQSSTISNNSNSKIAKNGKVQHQHQHQSIVVPRLSATIIFRPVSGGSIVRSTGSKIKLGS